jgi:flavin reductase (DIM6/NTAB) family NADH-FMN oxidoreductase RutF
VTVLGQAANVSTDAGYRQATGTVGTTGTQLTTGNHSGLTGAPVSIFTFTSASPKSLVGSTNTTGVFGDHFVFQVGCDSTTVPASPAPANTIVFRYDEA